MTNCTLLSFGSAEEMDSRLRGNDANDTPHIRCHSREGGNPSCPIFGE
jgi:hypothetical protein